MFSIFVYQKLTGPTSHVRGKIEVDNEVIGYKLIRTWSGKTDAEIKITVHNENVHGKYIYKRYKSFDTWDTLKMTRDNAKLIAYIPHQPPAGKVIYKIILTDDKGTKYYLTEEPVIIRFKEHVPALVLIPHIIFMFLAMFFSTRAGLEALFIKRKTYNLALLTAIFLLLGGLIFGPIVQKYAFDAYWTGWPFGNDLTDNKTAIAMLVWAYAVFQLHKNKSSVFWPVFAAIILLAIYLIPHSLIGSQLDFTQIEATN